MKDTVIIEDDPELTGGSSDYYKQEILLDTGEWVTIECRQVINAKNMNFSLGNIFKAVWRMSSKKGTSDVYDLEKIIFFALEEMRRRGFIKNKADLKERLDKIIGE